MFGLSGISELPGCSINMGVETAATAQLISNGSLETHLMRLYNPFEMSKSKDNGLQGRTKEGRQAS